SGVGREVSWCAVTSLHAPGFRNGVGACYVSRAVVHSIVPLAVLEAVKNLDTPVEDGLSEFAEELLSKRLGLSDTVAMQLREYEGMVRRDAPPDGSACALYGTGFTELLRLLVGFEGAMLHVSCRATGGAVCEWRAAPADPRHH